MKKCYKQTYSEGGITGSGNSGLKPWGFSLGLYIYFPFMLLKKYREFTAVGIADPPWSVTCCPLSAETCLSRAAWVICYIIYILYILCI
jgi:hypothetical protein